MGGFLLSFYIITFAGQDFPSPSTCLHVPRLAFASQDFPSPSTCLHVPRLAYTCLAQLPIACVSGFPVAADLPTSTCLHVPRLA